MIYPIVFYVKWYSKYFSQAIRALGALARADVRFQFRRPEGIGECNAKEQ